MNICYLVPALPSLPLTQLFGNYMTPISANPQNITSSFEPQTGMAIPIQSGDPSLVLTVWAKVIDLQMHFNEMCMNLRRTAIGTLGALLAAGALSFRFGGLIQIYDKNVSVALVFVVVALLVWLSFYIMDRFWYHELLRATVTYADELNAPAKQAGLLVPLDMSKKIRQANHTALGMSGGAKINLFYLLVAAALVLATYLLYSGVVQPMKA